jgi:NAD-dependent deacetylase
VVWFGEALPEEAFAAAVEAAAACDLLLTVGTSGIVYPAAEIPRIAARSGASVIQVNPEPTPLDRVCTVNLRGTAAAILPGVVAAAW